MRIRANLEEVSGYGQHIAHTGRQFLRLGVPLHYEAINSDWYWLPRSFRDHLAGDVGTGPVLQISPPMTPFPPPSRPTVLSSMWESTVLPAEFVPKLNGVRAIIVPSSWCRDVFRANGVTVPIEVVPLGVCPREYFPLHDPPRECRFGLVAQLRSGAQRKNLQGVVDAFLDAFGEEQDVHLAVKIGHQDDWSPRVPDTKVSVTRGFYSTEGMNWWYNSLSCLVSGSLGEGFGLCPLQAAACGRPTISTTWGGVAEHFDATVGYSVGYDLIRPEWFEGGGEMALPRRESLAARMREVYEDREGARAKGVLARERASRFTWDRHGERLLGLLSRFGCDLLD